MVVEPPMLLAEVNPHTYAPAALPCRLSKDTSTASLLSVSCVINFRPGQERTDFQEAGWGMVGELYHWPGLPAPSVLRQLFLCRQRCMH